MIAYLRSLSDAPVELPTVTVEETGADEGEAAEATIEPASEETPAGGHN